MNDSPAEVARTWLRAWDSQDLSLLRLSPDFVHTRPFGRIREVNSYYASVTNRAALKD